jgi:hypothetical protein
MDTTNVTSEAIAVKIAIRAGAALIAGWRLAFK